MGSTTESVPRESRDFRQTGDLKHRVQAIIGPTFIDGSLSSHRRPQRLNRRAA